MKATTVGDYTYMCPMYLVRCGDGWQVRVPGTPTRYFADAKHGGTPSAYRAALRLRLALAPVTNQKRPLADRERRTKRAKTGQSGVFLVRRKRGESRRLETHVEVRVPGMPTKTFYVGSGRAGRKRLPEKLEAAVEHRQYLETRLASQSVPSERSFAVRRAR